MKKPKMKKLTLNQTWKQCLRMWKWISKEWVKPTNIEVIDELKKRWCDKYSFYGLDDDCFFCTYSEDVGCPKCPGRLVDKDFDCVTPSYHCYFEPIKFYQKLVELNKKRAK